ncbi:GntR family transcriptional regulator [Clostridium sp. SM-530-WT-3G]|uniref:GntR family transcriptional regulator n=1 Tax=Clostridium sp. SM-530-WT-3G TaxID=2725303 RepID=UPI000EBE9145|nr:GntR family transcriptional regulator [Clostridium sp. SM-530-WT-3G]NME83234.1 GntR family transcriptional regulator [Clostridium sp. SM-530-WT-3G]HCW54059.1 GntR family transcriptional regulator [Clostridium sp.]
MDILISNDSPVKLYEQIENQIKNQILNGSLKSGEMLPSIRMLAKELKVSIITTKRAYEELEKEGFIETVVGKGTFVAGASSERLKEAAMWEMESRFEEVIVTAKSLGLGLNECIEILKNIYEEV